MGKGGLRGGRAELAKGLKGRVARSGIGVHIGVSWGCKFSSIGILQENRLKPVSLQKNGVSAFIASMPDPLEAVYESVALSAELRRLGEAEFVVGQMRQHV
jgi:hypothetical protein